ncbi:DivIVA domain-containing protein, partial [Staphylococcus hominis]
LVEAQLDLLKSEDWDYLLNYDLDAEQVTLEDIHHLNDNDLTPEERAMKNSQSDEQVNHNESTSESANASDSQSTSSNSTSNNQ